MTDCVFCKIVDHELPSTVRFETNTVLVFDNIAPKAPVHLLVIPKRHVVNVSAAADADQALLGDLLLACRDVAKQLNLKGFKVMANNGRSVGQSVDHLHLHLVSGQISSEALLSL